MWKNTMDKAIAKEIEEDKWKEKEDKRLKRATNVGFCLLCILFQLLDGLVVVEDIIVVVWNA
jgi:hypothetical protein